MHTFVLQDWVTIRGQSFGVVQSEPGWLDLSPFQDLFAWVDIREVANGSSTVDLFLETAPTEDEFLFQSMNGPFTAAVTTLAANTAPTIVKLPMLAAAVPLSRFLRWRLSWNGTPAPGVIWDVTMRIVVAANSPGM
jgi:hypothetical protein